MLEIVLVKRNGHRRDMGSSRDCGLRGNRRTPALQQMFEEFEETCTRLHSHFDAFNEMAIRPNFTPVGYISAIDFEQNAVPHCLSPFIARSRLSRS